MIEQYILRDDHTAEPCVDMLMWSKWYEKANRVVKRQKIGRHVVSTVFLGLNHQFGDGPPILFETMIYIDRTFLDYQDRCSTWDEALRMHKRGVSWVRNRKKAHA